MGSAVAPCPKCAESVSRCLKPFRTRARITAASTEVTRMLINQAEHHFPGLSRFVLAPSKPEIEAAQLFPINPERVAADCMSVQSVNAPLPFTAAIVACQCRQCALHHRVIHIGIPFYVMVSHMHAFLDGTHPASAKQIATFFASLYWPNPAWSAFPTPPASPFHHAIVASGMSWLLCHEVGHFAADETQPKVQLCASPAARSRFQEELNADFAALRILIHRTNARGLQRQPWLSLLHLGIAVLLRSWHVCIPQNQRAPDLFSYGPRLGAFIPSPTQRWELVQQHLNLQFKLGFISKKEHDHIEQQVLRNDAQKIESLVEELDVHLR